MPEITRFEAAFQSVEKTDRHDAAPLAEFLEKEMLPDAHLGSPKSEKFSRVITMLSGAV